KWGRFILLRIDQMSRYPLPASCFKKETETSPLIEVTIPALSGPDQGKPWVGVLRKLTEAGYY
ncbi:MAG TPA: hypothetical protein DCK79_04795, partial [Candidatus Atribacteria bacterium]|nr:hypothetical protein [Candidatus Atribacteria bacterium]